MSMQMQTDDSIKAHRHPRRGLLALPLAVALLAMASFSAYAQDAAVLAFSEGLLFDGSRSTIYAMESDALTARAADSGERLWSRPELAEPMALHQGRLLVLGRRDQPREPVAFWLDPATGATIGEFKLDLPEAVSFLISERPGERFQAQAFVDGGELVLHWHYVQRQLIGAPAVAGVNRAVKMPRLSGDSPSPAGGSAPIVDTTLVEESGLFRVRSNSATAIDRAEMGIAQFNRWEKLFGEARQQAADGEQYRSRSGGHVLASRLVDDEGWLRHQWTLIGEEGESLGQFRLPVAFAPFAVGDKVLAYESQPYIRFEGGDVLEARDLSLVVMDLESGRERWQTALLDKTWREGMPP